MIKKLFLILLIFQCLILNAAQQEASVIVKFPIERRWNYFCWRYKQDQLILKFPAPEKINLVDLERLTFCKAKNTKFYNWLDRSKHYIYFVKLGDRLVLDLNENQNAEINLAPNAEFLAMIVEV